MKIDFNQSMSMVKRMIKLADKNILDQQLVRKQLHSIAEYAKEESLLKAAAATQKCLQKILMVACKSWIIIAFLLP